MVAPVIHTVLRRRESFAALLKRASMSIFSFNTGVVRPMDEGFRIGVSSAHNPVYGDCVGVSIHQERNNPQHLWQITHISPARARILAQHLLRVADYVERQDGQAGKPDGIDNPTDTTEASYR